MGDDDAERADRPAVPVSRWMRRSTPEEMRDLDDFRTQSFLVQFYAVIPLMVVAAFLPEGPLRAIWIGLVVVGFSVWGIRHVMRASRKRKAGAEERDATAEGGSESGPPAADPGV